MDLAAFLEVGKRETAVVQVVDAEVKALVVGFARVAAVLGAAGVDFERRQVPDLVHLREHLAFLPVLAVGILDIEAAANPGIAIGLDAEALDFGSIHMRDVFHPAVEIL